MMSPGHVDALFSLCQAAARAAGDHALHQRFRSKEIYQQFDHDIKLQLDLECQAAATAVIHKADPGAIIIGEEGSSIPGAPGAVEWIIDPIDGTVNYFHGLNWWCSSVAVRVAGEVVAGVVYAPETNAFFAARVGQTATLNQKAISVGAPCRLADALLITGSEKELDPARPPLDAAQRLAPLVRKVRILGAAALDLCQIAAGNADVFFQHGLYVWDVAAAELIIRQAGGTVHTSALAMPNRYRVVAAAQPDMAREIESVLAGPV